MSNLIPDVQEGSLSIYGHVDQDLLQREVKVAFGHGANDREWDVKTGMFGELINSNLIEFQRGQKDGWAMTQGSLVAPQRIARNVEANYFMLLDCDTGDTIERVHDRLDELGWFAILWTTYSHGKDRTEISEAKLIKWCREHKVVLTDDNRLQLVRDYLREVTLLHEDIAASITAVTRSHGEGGVKYVATHAPMPRLRIMLLLDEPFAFGDGSHGTQNEAIAAWKAFYTHVANKMGVAWDQSCVDPSRLMYTPRIAPDADESQHEIRIVAGHPITYEKSNTSSDNPYLQAADHLGVAKTTQSFKTKNLLKFMKGSADDFEIIEWLDAAGTQFLSRGTDKAELECPNADAHSEQRVDDRAFMVSNASAGLSGFHAGCLHNSCKTESGGDRAWWLDKLCEQHGVEDAMELLPWCPNHVADEQQLQQANETMAAQTGRASPDQVRAALQTIIDLNDGVEEVLRLQDLVRSSRWPKGELNDLLKAMRRQTRNTEQEPNDGVPPIPADPADIVAIYSNWEKDARRNAAKKLIEFKNFQAPVIYTRKEGGCVYIERVPTGVRASEFDTSNQKRWDALCTRLSVKFRSVEDGIDNADKETPGGMTGYFAGVLDWQLPTLDRVVHVPVFDKHGDLVWDQGYHSGAQVFYDPPKDIEFYPVPEEPDQDEVENARNILFDILRDFPFSDCFDGSDPLPIRSNELDEDGHPLPNLKRGKGSRANALAMIIQPFVREMISGPCPNYHIDKPERGTGAGYLVDTAWSIFEGTERAKVQTLSHTDEEIKKSITSSLRSGQSMLFLDNIQHKVENADIAAALTAGTWTDRILGGSNNATIPIRVTWIMAGNRVPFSEDMMRRNVPIFMDAATKNPAADRADEYYKHHPLHSVLMERRADHVWACHVLVQHWVSKGCPAGSVSMQSFTEWVRVLGGILETAGIQGFLSNRKTYMVAQNEDQSVIEEVTKRVYKKFDTKPLRVNDVFDALVDKGVASYTQKEDQIDPTLGLQLSGRDKVGQLKALGLMLSREYVGKTVAIDDEGTLGSWMKGRDKNGVFYRIVRKNVDPV
jgi:hypothetical protein